MHWTLVENFSYFVQQKYLVRKKHKLQSLDVYLYVADGYIFIDETFINAHPHLYVIGGGLWQLPVEPRRSVEGAAGTCRPTPSTIPQRIVSIKDVKLSKSAIDSGVTEVVFTYECGGRDG